MYQLSWWKKIQIYYLPFLRPALVSGILLVFLYVVADFGAVSILRMETLTVKVYREMIYYAGAAEASFVSLGFIVFSLIFTYLALRFTGVHIAANKSAAKSRSAIIENTASKSILAMGIIGVILSLSLLFPVSKVVTWLYLYAQDTSVFKEVWTNSKLSLLQLSLTTLIISTVATVSSVLLSYIYFLTIRRKRKYSYPYIFSVALYTVPGIIVAFSVLVLRQNLFSPNLIWLIFFYAYILRFSGISFITMAPAFKSIPHQYIQVGSIFFRERIQYIRRIILPITFPSVLQSVNYTFFNSIRELTVPLLLLPIGVEVLPLRIWQTANEGLYVFSSPAIAVLLLISFPSLLLYIKDQI